MQIIPLLMKELEYEAATTKKMLERVPDEKFAWKPHEKSMSMQDLVAHIADLPGWITMVFNSSELDFSNTGTTWQPPNVTNKDQLMEFLEKSVAGSKAAFEKAQEDDLTPMWTLRNGDQVYSVQSKYEVIRMTFAQIAHHRAQLGVYLRLLNIPIPGSYGPSADEA